LFKSLLLKTAAGINLTQSELFAPVPETRKKEQSSAKSSAQPPTTIGVIGAKGGVGATTLSINLAVALSQNHGMTKLIDANLQQPDAAILLGQTLHCSIGDLVERHENVDKSLLDACFSPLTHAPECSLIGPLNDGSSALTIDLGQIADCLRSIKYFSAFWLLDLPHNLDKHLVELMDKCDRLILVLEPTIAAIASANRWLKVFAELGYPQNKVICVLNRSGSKVSAVENELRNFNQFANALRVPNSYAFLERCSNEGQPAIVKNPRDPYSTGITQLAKFLAGDN